ncbi:MAG: HU family DNA-binding protein [Flavobacteriia bacterium]|nr:HU family DNA-binding protein [Flavobacteriia bacterium]
MNKAELISAIADKTGKQQKEVKAFLEAFESTVKETLSKGDKITLIGFGTFDVQNVPARTGRNPQTGAVLQIKAKKKPRFKAGAELSATVN